MGSRGRRNVALGVLAGIVLIAVVFWLCCRRESCCEAQKEDNPFATPFAVVPRQERCELSPEQAQMWSSVASPGSNRPLIHGVGSGGQGFCVYKWTGSGLPTPGDFESIHAIPDSPILGGSAEPPRAPQNNPGSLASGPPTTFKRLSGGLEETAWRALYDAHLGKPQRPVKVVVIDASPVGKGILGPDRSEHGFTVCRLIGALACRDLNGPECQKQIVPSLALPLIGEIANDFSEDLVNGGRTGALFHLHDALEGAIERWDPADHHLVINLSMGWDPIKTLAGNELVASIKRLLQKASCKDALVVAAAGNYTGSDGPVYPAAFEADRRPSAPECAALGLPKVGERTTLGRYEPLVFAVGAVDEFDQRTLIDRRWSQPRLAALGIEVRAPGLPGSPDLEPRSGTSMSTAIVSGIAAAVWTARPELDSIDVMQMVYAGGKALDGGTTSRRARTEFCVGEPDGPCLGENKIVRRASLCGAMAIALGMPRLGADCEASRPKPSRPTAGPDARSVPTPSDRLTSACRMTNCGRPRFPASSQAAAGVASHTGGVAGCPECKFRLAFNGLDYDITLEGSPKLVNLTYPTARLTSAVLNVPGGSPHDLQSVAFGKSLSSQTGLSGPYATSVQIDFTTRTPGASWDDQVQVNVAQ